MSNNKVPHLKTVIYEKRGAVLIISLNRPQALNAQNKQLISDFILALKAAQRDTNIKVIILRGEGRAFCAGMDLSMTSSKPTKKEIIDYMEITQDITRTILNLDKPVIAAIHGYAIGGGADWAMNSDIRIAARGTKFGWPELEVGGCFSNAESKILPLLVGLGRSKELVFTGKMINTTEAEKWGLVNRVVPLKELDKVAMEMAENIAKKPAFAVSIYKRALNQGISQNFEETLQREIADALSIFNFPGSIK